MIHKLTPKDYTCAMKNSLTVSYLGPSQRPQAEEFAARHSLPCLPMETPVDGLCLYFGADRVEIRDLQMDSTLHVDFIGGPLAHRKKYGGGRGQAIARAIGLKPGLTPPRVLDATAGLGKDAFVLACLGCPVTLVERSPVVAALVEDAIRRAADDEDFHDILANGFELVNAHAIDYMASLDDTHQPDVVYLDPMYPHRKKSAQVKKNMQILQKLLGQDADTEQLLETALKCAGQRVVVKRPKGAEIIGSVKPTTCIESKKTRYDVYVTRLYNQKSANQR